MWGLLRRALKAWFLRTLAVLVLMGAAIDYGCAGGGWTVSSPVWMTPQDSSCPSVSVDSDGRGHVAWHEKAEGNYSQIHYTTNTGGGFAAPVVISQSVSQHCYWPVLRVNGGDIHASWTRQEAGEDLFDIWYRKNSGGAWGTFMNASNSSIKSLHQSMAVRGALGPVLSWEEALYAPDNFDVLFTEWSGSSFGSSINVSQTPGGMYYGSIRPHIVICPNTDVVLVWVDRISNDYRINARRRAGGVWQARQELSTLRASPQKPGVAVGPDNQVHVVYVAEPSEGVFDLWYQKWNGSSWTSPEMLPNQPEPNMLRPNAAVDDNGVVHVVADNSSYGVGEIHHISKDSGVWSAWTNVSNTANSNSLNADIAHGGGVLTAVWQDNSDGVGGTSSYHTYYAKRYLVGAPQPVTSFTVVPSDAANRLYWTNPGNGPFWATMIRYKMTGCPASPTDGALVCDKAAPPGSEDWFVHEGLVNGQTYFYAAFAHDNSGNYAAGVNGHGTPHPITCLEAKKYADGEPVDLNGKVVTAVFSAETCIYVEEPDRTSAIRVVTSGAGLGVGDIVNVTGTVTSRVLSGIAAERQIEDAAVTKTGTGSALPLAMPCWAVGGSALSDLAPGVKNGLGLHNMGLLATIAGRATDVIGNYLYIDDGSEVGNLYGSFTPKTGVMVKCPSTPNVQAGDIVAATGVILGSVPSGWPANRPYMQLRTMADLRVIGLR